MTDGANLGVTADRALETVLGGASQPSEEERATPEQVRERISAAVARGGSPDSYGDCADMVAGMVLAFYDKRPEAREWPMERGGSFVADKWVPNDGPDLYAEVKAFSDGKLDDLGITGFQWGWAVNAARYASSLPPQPNPAILTIGTA